MKRFLILSAVLFLALFILLPGSGSGKYNVSKPLIADGWPLPPPPPSLITNTLIADGAPLPPPIPPGPSATLVADGWPLPPPPPPSGSYVNTLEV